MNQASAASVPPTLLALDTATETLHLALLAELRSVGQLDLSRACVDGASVASVVVQ